MNWPQYNKNLVKRGSIDLWISEDIADWWYRKEESTKVGKPPVYSNRAIEVCLAIKCLYNMPYRMTEGFMNSLFTFSNLPLKAPCYTQIDRRSANVHIPEIKVQKGANLIIAIDSTGLKVYGEGEWKVRMHGASKRREWRKLHLATDVNTKIIYVHKLTSNAVDDATAGAQLLEEKFDGCVKKALGDGAYDKTKMYEQTRNIGARLITPPAKNAIMQQTSINSAKVCRDQAIARIKMLGNDEDARKYWKKETGYHKRSIAETSMYRFKQIFTDKLHSRKLETQSSEASIKVNILNTFARIGF